jgi:toxin YoeB
LKLLWTADAWDDYLRWQSGDAAMAGKINLLLAEIRRHPFTGTGKPEPLKGNLAGWWSRRLSGEHRLVYRVVGSGDTQRVEVAQCRYHY